MVLLVSMGALFFRLGGGGGGGRGGFIFKWGTPHGGASVLMAGGLEKNCRIGGAPYALPTVGNPVQENKAQNMFKVNNKSTRCCPHKLFWLAFFS